MRTEIKILIKDLIREIRMQEINPDIYIAQEITEGNLIRDINMLQEDLIQVAEEEVIITQEETANMEPGEEEGIKDREEGKLNDSSAP